MTQDNYPTNKDPCEKWNDRFYRNDPFAPWNDRMKRRDPAACWNSPWGDGEYRDEVDDY